MEIHSHVHTRLYVYVQVSRCAFTALFAFEGNSFYYLHISDINV